jgi:hypothetical protein
MKKILLGLTFICVSIMANAQSAGQSTPTGTGSFDVIRNTSKGEEHINVNYALFPAPFVNILNINFNTPDPMMLSIKLLNSNSELVMNWMPSQAASRYDHSFDISNLSAGTYKMEIYGPEAKLVKTVTFEKQTGASGNSGAVISK